MGKKKKKKNKDRIETLCYKKKYDKVQKVKSWVNVYKRGKVNPKVSVG